MAKDFLPTNTFFYPRTRLSPYFEGTQAAGAKACHGKWKTEWMGLNSSLFPRAKKEYWLCDVTDRKNGNWNKNHYSCSRR